MRNLFVAALMTLGISALAHASEATIDQSAVTVSTICANPMEVAVIVSTPIGTISGQLSLANKTYGAPFSAQFSPIYKATPFSVPRHPKNQPYTLNVTAVSNLNGLAFFCTHEVPAVNACPKSGTNDAVVVFGLLPTGQFGCMVSAY